MPLDHWQLLAWMAEREEREPGMPTLFGTNFLQGAAGLAGGDGLPWDAVARCAAHLKRLGQIDWRYLPTPGDRPEPPLEFIDSGFLQRVQGIHVTDRGHAALASRQQRHPTQINIVNSTVGQVALGDIQNIDIFVVLDAMERSLADLDASAEDKQEARSAIARMRQAGGAVAGSAASSVLAAALRQALGLP
jgi:hypothetical protein